MMVFDICPFFFFFQKEFNYFKSVCVMGIVYANMKSNLDLHY